MLAATSKITQMYGSSTNTFHAIQYARLVLQWNHLLCISVFFIYLIYMVGIFASVFLMICLLFFLSCLFICCIITWLRTNDYLIYWKVSTVSALFSQWGFDISNGGRPGAAKVMVVVTDGESHDSAFSDTVISDCEAQGITRFGIAVSDDLQFNTNDIQLPPIIWFIF